MPKPLRSATFALAAVLLFFAGVEGLLWGVGQGARLALSRRTAPIGDGETTLVAFTGDSVTFGLNVGPPFAYPAQLEQLPAMQALGVQANNLGVAGIRLQESVLRAGEGLEAAPNTSVVVNLSGYNDCKNVVGLGQPPAAETRRGRWLRDLLVHTRTYRLVAQLLLRRSRPTSAGASPPPPPGPDAVAGTPAEAAQVCRDRIAQAVEDFVHRVAESRSRLLLVTYPVPTRSPAVLTPKITALVNRALRVEASRWSLPLADAEACVRVVEATGAADLFDADGIHLTEAGNAALAGCVAPELQQMLGDRGEAVRTR